MKVAAIIAARMNSERMYGKPMKEIKGKSIIWHVVERLKRIKCINEIIIATSDKSENDVFIEFANENNLKFYRGDEEDVLDRFYHAAKENDVDVILRLTSENPLLYIDHVDPLVEEHINENFDFSYMSKLPVCCFVEVISFRVLEDAWKNGSEKHRSELVTLYIEENSGKYNMNVKEAPTELQRDYRLTVDTPKDLELMREIYGELYKENEIVTLKDAIKFLDDNPDIAKINKDIPVGTSRIW